MTKVEGTNDYSIVSKLSAARAGYFADEFLAAKAGYVADEFLAEFVERPRKRAQLINWGYYLREGGSNKIYVT